MFMYNYLCDFLPMQNFPSEFGLLWGVKRDYCCNMVSHSQPFSSPRVKLKEGETFQFYD